MTTSSSPFPKLSQAWRVARLTGVTFGAAALSGLVHLVWADRTAIIAVAVGAGEAAYRKAFPSGQVAGQLANLVAAYRQVTAPAKVEPVTAADTPITPIEAVDPAAAPPPEAAPAV